MKALVNGLLGRSIVGNKGFFKELMVVLVDLARMPDEDIDDELLDLLEQLCTKMCGLYPDREANPLLRKMLDELCGVRLPRLRLRFNTPPSTKKVKKFKP